MAICACTVNTPITVGILTISCDSSESDSRHIFICYFSLTLYLNGGRSYITYSIQLILLIHIRFIGDI